MAHGSKESGITPLSRAISDRFSTFESIQEAMRSMSLESSNMIFAIDYTAANKAQIEGTLSLHDLGQARNQYQDVLTRISRVLMEFDDDNRLPVYGLGGHTEEGEPSGMFSFTPENPTNGCRSFGEIIQRYRSITPKVQLADAPLNFAPVVREAIACAEKDPGGFYMVIIISTGQMNEVVELEMAQAIVDASNYPITIITIGVGGGPWESMEKFDNAIPQRHFDNFQFVDYQEAMAAAHDTQLNASGDGEVADLLFTMQILMEVPSQYAEMKRLGYL